MRSITAALDKLAAEDLTGLPGPVALDELRELLPLVNRLNAEIARTVRRCEVSGASEHDGAKTMAAWLRGHARLSPSAAAQLVRVGRALEALPAVAELAAPHNLAVAVRHDVGGVARALILRNSGA